MAEVSKDGGSAAAAAAGGDGGTPTVKSIFVYPIKSCRGISVSQALLSSTGFVWDRQWVVVNSKGRGCTQRVEPKLALVQVELPMEAFSQGWEPKNTSYMGQMYQEISVFCTEKLVLNALDLVPAVVRAPGMAELNVPLTKPSLQSDGVSVWEWSGSALDEGETAAKWFTDFLGKPSRLVRFNEDSESRPVDPHYAPGFNVKFTDAFPVHLISQASLDAVNEQLKEPVNINRFRPNIFVDGCESFAEDLWKQIKINELTFQGVMLCPRCKVPTINQEDAMQGSEPTETMMKFRSAKALEVNATKTKYKGRVYLGQMLVCEDKDNSWRKVINVGDIIHVEKVLPSYADVAV